MDGNPYRIPPFSKRYQRRSPRGDLGCLVKLQNMVVTGRKLPSKKEKTSRTAVMAKPQRIGVLLKKT